MTQTTKEGDAPIVFSTQHVLYLLCGVVALFCIPAYQEFEKGAAEELAAKAPARAIQKEAERELLAIQDMAPLAMQRVAANCVPIVDDATGHPIYLSEATRAIARGTQQALTAGTQVCNSFGETAEVGPNGNLIRLSRVPTAELEDYKALFSKLINR